MTKIHKQREEEEEQYKEYKVASMSGDLKIGSACARKQYQMGNYGWELLSKYLIIQRENFNLFLYSEFSETKTNKLRKEIGIFAHIAQWARL